MPRALVSPLTDPPIELEYETFGDRTAPPVLLIMGTGQPLVVWSPDFCHELAAHGYFVIRFDNRDIGRSTKVPFPVDPSEVILSAFADDPILPPYTVPDMAADAAGLLDHLGVGPAHVVGVSLGGVIAQWLAIDHPERVASLGLIMSTTCEPGVGAPDPAVLPALLSNAVRTETTVDAFVDAQLGLRRVLAGDVLDEEHVRQTALATWDHAVGPQNVAHHLAALVHSPPTAARLAEVAVPTVVVHGTADRLVDPSGGRRIAELVAGARMVEIAGMGHDLPRALWSEVSGVMLATMRRAPVVPA